MIWADCYKLKSEDLNSLGNFVDMKVSDTLLKKHPFTAKHQILDKTKETSVK